MFAIGRRFLDRRKAPRFTISKDSKILFRNGSCQMGCTIVEISNTGARLFPADAALLPNEFELLVTPGTRVRCEAVHRSANEIGVRFLS
jgi:hypothetical protein